MSLTYAVTGATFINPRGLKARGLTVSIHVPQGSDNRLSKGGERIQGPYKALLWSPS